MEADLTTATWQQHVDKHPRDVRVDAATGILITLVVYGHVLSSLPGGFAHALLQWLFMFHVPAFVFVSGYVTRYSSHWSALDLAGRLLLPLVIFQLAHRLVITVWEDRPFSTAWPVPAWTLWYLAALFVWRLFAPLMARVPFWLGVLAATSLSVGVGAVAWAGGALSLGRIVGFLPFFVAGLTWDERWWRWLLRGWTWVAGLVALLAAAVWARFRHGAVNRHAWWFSESYGDLDVSALTGAGQRLGILVVAAGLVLAFLTIAMHAWRAVATIGLASLPIYLVHPLLLYPWHLDGAPQWWGTPAGLLAALAASCLFCWAVSRGPVLAALRPLYDYRWWTRRGTGAGSRPVASQ